jgi:hypothetical protein
MVLVGHVEAAHAGENVIVLRGHRRDYARFAGSAARTAFVSA